MAAKSGAEGRRLMMGSAKDPKVIFWMFLKHGSFLFRRNFNLRSIFFNTSSLSSSFDRDVTDTFGNALSVEIPGKVESPSAR
jgi:hypothetical protein